MLDTRVGHPVMRDEYAIFTNSISKFFEQVSVWLDNGVPGAFVYGRPRVGKTRAIRFWLNDLLTEKYGSQVLMYRTVMKLHQNHTENNFLDALITSVKGCGLSNPRNRSKNQKYSLVTNHIATESRDLDTNKVVYVIDEAQNIPQIGYRWLCNFQNELDELGIKVTFILVGTMEIKYSYETFSITGEAQVVGRFMLYHSEFSGVKFRKELDYIFEGYDSSSEWPEGSGQSFTQFFFQKAFKNGFRLQDYTDCFWNVYTDLFPGEVSKIDIPMEHIGKAVNYIFRVFGDVESDYIELNEQCVKEAIEYTQFQDYVNSVR